MKIFRQDEQDRILTLEADYWGLSGKNPRKYEKRGIRPSHFD